MAGDQGSRALARIEQALARIEAASRSAASDDSARQLRQLEERHSRLRGAVQDSLSQLDQLIEGAQG